MPASAITISSSAYSHPRYPVVIGTRTTSSSYSDEGFMGTSLTDDESSRFGAPLSRTSTSSDMSFRSRNVYPIHELLSLQSSPSSRTLSQSTSSSLKDTFPEIFKAQHDDSIYHDPHHRQGSKRSSWSKNTKAKKASSHTNTNDRHANDISISKKSPVNPGRASPPAEEGWTYATGHPHHTNNPHHQPHAKPAEGKRAEVPTKRSPHGHRPASSWMSNDRSKGSRIDALDSWR